MDLNNSMTLREALDKAINGDFISHIKFNPDESIHWYNGSFYYEDNSRLGNLECVMDDDIAKSGWYVKRHSYDVDTNKLKLMHIHQMKWFHYRNDVTYESCFK